MRFIISLFLTKIMAVSLTNQKLNFNIILITNFDTMLWEYLQVVLFPMPRQLIVVILCEYFFDVDYGFEYSERSGEQ
mgnify:CR=1 FL=1